MKDIDKFRMDVEFYLLNREYNELSSVELAIVNEHIESEQEFNQMKAVLMGVGNFFKEDRELEASPAIKAALLKEFDKQQPARVYWLNGIFVSLFPKEKKFFQKPGMQLIGLAASVLLIVTIAFNGNVDINNSKLSQYEDVKAEEEVVEEVGKLERDVANEEKSLVENLESDLENEVTTLYEVEIEEKFETSENKGTQATVTYDLQPMENVDADLPKTSDADYLRNENNLNTSKESFKNDISKNKEVTAVADDKLVVSVIAPTTSEVIEEFSLDDDEGYFTDIVSAAAGASANGNDSMDLPLNSRTLAEDADLIEILYTAM